MKEEKYGRQKKKKRKEKKEMKRKREKHRFCFSLPTTSRQDAVLGGRPRLLGAVVSAVGLALAGGRPRRLVGAAAVVEALAGGRPRRLGGDAAETAGVGVAVLGRPARLRGAADEAADAWAACVNVAVFMSSCEEATEIEEE